MAKNGDQKQETECFLKTSGGGYANIAIYKDTTTNVEYVVVSKDDLSGVAVAICPRYNSDGTFFTGK